MPAFPVRSDYCLRLIQAVKATIVSSNSRVPFLSPSVRPSSIRTSELFLSLNTCAQFMSVAGPGLACGAVLSLQRFNSVGSLFMRPSQVPHFFFSTSWTFSAYLCCHWATGRAITPLLRQVLRGPRALQSAWDVIGKIVQDR